MKCAKCSSNLNEQSIIGISIDTCNNCGGVFLEESELNKIISDGNPSTFKENLQNVLYQTDSFRAVCPACEKPMDRIERVENNMALDMCSSCKGIWLDRGELSKIDQIEDKPKDPYNIAKLRIKALADGLKVKKVEKEKIIKEQLNRLRQTAVLLNEQGLFTQQESLKILEDINFREKQLLPTEKQQQLLALLDDLKNSNYINDFQYQEKKNYILKNRNKFEV